MTNTSTTTEQTEPSQHYSETARQFVKGCSNWSDIQYKLVPSIAELLQERDDAATSMRDLCVEKVKEMLTTSYDYRGNTPMSVDLFKQNVIRALESLTLEAAANETREDEDDG